MDSQPVRELLKTSPKRSVHLESSGRPGRDDRRIVKRFHGPDLLDRFRDRLRARNEYELLGRLHALGLPVPRALELGRRRGAWEVVTEYLDGARPLDEWLRDTRSAGFESHRSGVTPGHCPDSEGRATPELDENTGVTRAALARELGRLVARLFAAGLDHRDMHPGNFLVQQSDSGPPTLWLIDVAKSRLRARVTAGQMLDDLVQLAAGVRELVDDASRRRFLVAFLTQLPADLRRQLPARTELGRSIEDAARVFRGRDIARRTRRWLRESSSVVPYDDERGRGFVRRDLEHEFPREVARALGSGRWLRDGRIEVGERAALIVEAGSWDELCEIWKRQVRLFTHGLPCLAPLCIARAPRSWVALEAERGWSPLTPGSIEDVGLRARLVASLGCLMGGLHDRLLDVSGLTAGSLWHDRRGRVRFGLLPGLTDRLAEDGRQDAANPLALFEGPRRMLEEWTGPWSTEDDARYRHAYASGLRHSVKERARILTEDDA